MLHPLLRLRETTWQELVRGLAKQGGGIRESGAFLLGRMADGLRDARTVIPYDTLSPEALQGDFVQLDAAAFAKLWRRCDETGLEVVADVHTHQFAPVQSRSDRTNPMVALPGHVAIILPNFAHGVTSARDIGLHQYLGSHRWASWFKEDAADRVEICRGL